MGEEKKEEEDVDVFLSRMREGCCERWYKKNKWWVEKFDRRYEVMKEVMDECDEKRYEDNGKLKKKFSEE
ncbi:hypothetical protein, partial [Bacillus sp. WP8]|uniref:hypothetical protein n=1 Tax=Bacillus sp. WP8 TaxID=756828 RepID=UPI001C930013